MNPDNLLHQLITLSRRGKFNYSPIRLATETPTLATNSTLCAGQVKVETLEKDFFPTPVRILPSKKLKIYNQPASKRFIS